MSLFTRFIPVVVALGTGMIVYGLLDFLKHGDKNIYFTQTNEMCQLCGIISEAHIWQGVAIEDHSDRKKLIYCSDSTLVLCSPCRNQSSTSIAWSIMQKKER